MSLKKIFFSINSFVIVYFFEGRSTVGLKFRYTKSLLSKIKMQNSNIWKIPDTYWINIIFSIEFKCEIFLWFSNMTKYSKFKYLCFVLYVIPIFQSGFMCLRIFYWSTLKEAKNSMFLRDFSGTWGEAWTNKSSSKSPHKSSLGSGLGLGLFMVVDPDGGARNWNLFIFAGLFSLLLFVQNIPDLFKILSKSI